MNENTKTIIRYRLKRARECLIDANNLFKSESLHSTINRIYYAMYYSVNALLLTKKLSSSKHSGVRSLFNKEFVNSGDVDKELGKFFSKIFDKRQVGDYKDLVEFKKEDVEMWLNKAEEFITRIDELTIKIMEEKK